MITPDVEDVRFAFVTGAVLFGALGLLVGYCIRKTRKPPMASHSTHFRNHGRVRNWKLPPSAR